MKTIYFFWRNRLLGPFCHYIQIRALAFQPLHNEKILLQYIAQGDQDAFAAVYNHYLPRLYRYIYPFVRQSHEETEEILQDIFFKIWLRKETLPALSSFEHYLLRMTRNRIIDGIRKNQLHQQFLQEESATPPAHSDDPESDYRLKEYNQAAQLALQQMTDKRRIVFELHTQQDMTLEQIGQSLNISRSAAKKHLYAATRLIKQALQKNGEWLGTLFLLLARKFH
jgi:RNA polymerase sigma-70 factor (ECF subfamily)